MCKVTLYLVRHGETEENKQRILQGHLPGTLTDEGKNQARMVGRELRHESLQVIYSSDLKRCVDTTQILNEEMLLPVHYLTLLRERDWGKTTGVSLLKERVSIDPNAESVEAMQERARKLIALWLKECAGKKVLVVSHGLFLRILTAVVQNVSYKEVVPLKNAEIRVLTL